VIDRLDAGDLDMSRELENISSVTYIPEAQWMTVITVCCKKRCFVHSMANGSQR
jgi:hypothetical protein